MDKIKILIVDDHNIVRDGLKTLVDTRASDIVVVGTAVNGLEAVRMTMEMRPDVILMDIRMPVMDGVEATRAIRQECPDAKILVLTTFDEEAFIIGVMSAGANGYLLKDVPFVELVGAIRTVHAGGVLINPKVAQILVDRASGIMAGHNGDLLGSEILSGKERQVLSLVAQGLDNKAIAKQLLLSEGTVRNYVSRIDELIGVHDRAQAVVWAIRHKITEE